MSNNIVIDNDVIQTIVSTSQVETIVTSVEQNVLVKESQNQVVTDTLIYNTIVAGQPGPPGPPGTTEDEVVYAKKVDFVTEVLAYRGEAAVGSTASSASWRIRRIDTAIDGDVSETWAEGNAEFNKIWDNRESYSYS